MSGAMREKDDADYDLERFIEMFDEALMSDDPRVKNALRQLMMMVILTDVSDHEANTRSRRGGPLRRLFEDVREISSKLYKLDEELRELRQRTNGLVTYGGGGYRSEGWPKDWQGGPNYTLGGPTWAVAQSTGAGQVAPVALDDLNIKINSITGSAITGKK